MAKSFNDRDGWIWMNGDFLPWREAKSHIITQGLHYEIGRASCRERV